jgi:hypothetical protein
MGTIENLEFIKDKGVVKFLSKEEGNWHCSECGAVVWS